MVKKGKECRRAERFEYLERAELIVVEDETADTTGEDDVASKEISTWRAA
jgi:hypothetical protein